MKKKKKFKKGDIVGTPKGIGLIVEIKFSHIHGTLMVVKLRQSTELFKPKELSWPVTNVPMMILSKVNEIQHAQGVTD